MKVGVPALTIPLHDLVARHGPTVTGIRVVRKGADQTVTNSTTLVNDNNFQWVLPHTDEYLLRMVLYISGPTAGGFRFAFSLPSGGSYEGYCQDDLGPLGAGGTLPLSNFTTTKIYSTLSASPACIVVEGFLYAGSTDAVTFQWAQGTANVSGTSLFSNSFAILYRVGV